MDPPDPNIQDFKKTSLIEDLIACPLTPSRTKKNPPEDLLPFDSDDDMFD